jgi:hypothetical protein
MERLLNFVNLTGEAETKPLFRAGFPSHKDLRPCCIAQSDIRFPMPEKEIRDGRSGFTLAQINQNFEPEHWQFEPGHSPNNLSRVQK